MGFNVSTSAKLDIVSNVVFSVLNNGEKKEFDAKGPTVSGVIFEKLRKEVFLEQISVIYSELVSIFEK